MSDGADSGPNSQELMSFLRDWTRAEEQRGRWRALMAMGLVVVGAVVLAVWSPGSAKREGADLADLRAEVQALRSQVLDLEASHRAMATQVEMGGETSPAEPGASVPSSPVASHSVGKPEAGYPDPVAGLSPSARDAFEKARATQDSTVAEAVAKAKERPVTAPPLESNPTEPGGDSGSESDDESAVADAEESAVSEGPGETAADSAEAGPVPTLTEIQPAFQQLMADAGLELSLMQGEARSGELGLFDVVVLRRSGPRVGSISGDRLTLERDPKTQSGVLTFEGAREIRDGFTVEHPDGKLQIEIPGILPVDLIRPPLAGLFGLGEGTGGEAAPVPAASQVIEQVNRVLRRQDGLALRLRGLAGVRDGRMIDAVFDLEFDRDRDPVRSVRAEQAWWDVHESLAYVELRCEGGELTVDGKRRPLFRNQFRLPMRGVDVTAFRALPAVMLVSPLPEESEETTAGGE